jgi:hypothetical protein
MAKWAWEKVHELDEESPVATYYLDKLEDYALQPRYAEYQYTIPISKSDDSDSVEERVEKLKNAIQKNKMSHLMLVRKWMLEDGDETAAATLEALCRETHEPDMIKEMAAATLLEQGNKRVKVSRDRELVEIDTPLQWANEGLSIFDCFLHDHGELDGHCAFLCHVLLMEKRNDPSLSLRNAQAWAAAVDYLGDGLKGLPSSQKTVAQRYGVSVSTVGKYVKTLRGLYEEPTDEAFSNREL